MKIIALSDTHNRHEKLIIPECDLLIHAGDWSFQGYEHETRNFARWLNKQDAAYIVIIPGNHEVNFEKNWPKSLQWIKEECPAAHVLIHDSIEIEGIKIFGSAWTPWFFDWAYNGARTVSEQLHYSQQYKLIPLMKDLWKEIPEDTDILITHGPPYDILDELCYVDGTPKGQFVGCVDLRERVIEVKPDLHFFGHIHSGHGEKHVDGTSFYNVAICDEIYYPSNSVRIVEYEKEIK